MRLRNITAEQLQARVTPLQAAPLLLSHLEALCSHIFTSLLKPMLEPHQVFLLAREQAFFKALFFSGDRAADLALVKTRDILRFPDNSGFLFNHLWSKTLRQGDQNVFALKRAVNKLICPVLGIAIYVKICNLLAIDVTKGFLFRSLSKEKYIAAINLILQLLNQD